MQHLSFGLVCLACIGCGLRVQPLTERLQRPASSKRRKSSLLVDMHRLERRPGLQSAAELHRSKRRASHLSTCAKLEVFARLLCTGEGRSAWNPSNLAMLSVGKPACAGCGPSTVNGWSHRSLCRRVASRHTPCFRMAHATLKAEDEDEDENIAFKDIGFDDANFDPEMQDIEKELSGTKGKSKRVSFEKPFGETSVVEDAITPFAQLEDEEDIDMDDIEFEDEDDEEVKLLLETQKVERKIKEKEEERERKQIAEEIAKDVERAQQEDDDNEDSEMMDNIETDESEDDLKLADYKDPDADPTQVMPGDIVKKETDEKKDDDEFDFDKITDYEELEKVYQEKMSVRDRRLKLLKDAYRDPLDADGDLDLDDEEAWEDQFWWDATPEDEVLGRRTPDPTYRERLLSPKRAYALMMNESFGPLTVLDTRSLRQHCLGRIPGSEAFPTGAPSATGLMYVYYEGFEEGIVKKYGEDHPLLIFCNHGEVSRAVAYGLHCEGHNDIRIVKGGFEGWCADDLPIEEGIPDGEQFEGINLYPKTFEELWADWPEDAEMQPVDFDKAMNLCSDEEEVDEWDVWETEVVGGSVEEQEAEEEERDQRLAKLEELMSSLDDPPTKPRKKVGEDLESFLEADREAGLLDTMDSEDIFEDSIDVAKKVDTTVVNNNVLKADPKPKAAKKKARGGRKYSKDNLPVWYVTVDPDDLEDKADRDELKTYKVFELKSYLLDNGLSLSGTKADLINRISAHVGQL